MQLYNLGNDKLKKNIDKMERLLSKGNNVVIKVQFPIEDWSFNQVSFYYDFEKEIEYYSKYYNMMAEAADLGFDNIPYFRVDFARVAWLMSIAYGCQVVMMNNLISTKPMVTEDIEEVYNIKKKKDIQDWGFYPEITKRMLEIQRRYGDVPFVPSDVQSPIDVATQIVCTEVLLISMYENPEAVRYLLNIITESIEEICRFQRGIVNNWLGYGHDYPLPCGIHLSDDNAAFMSPDTYRKFALPYSQKLSMTFGGVTYHCCMGYKQNMKPMTETEGFLGFDPQITHNPVEDILDSISGKGFWRVYSVPAEADPLETYKYLIDITDGRCGLYIDIYANSRGEGLRLGEAVKEYAVEKGRA